MRNLAKHNKPSKVRAKAQSRITNWETDIAETFGAACDNGVHVIVESDEGFVEPGQVALVGGKPAVKLDGKWKQTTMRKALLTVSRIIKESESYSSNSDDSFCRFLYMAARALPDGV